MIFVEGDTDEVLFKALIDYYRTVSKTELRPYRICNLRGVTRYTSKLIAKLQNEYLPEAKKKGYQIHLNLTTIPKSLKGNNGNAKLTDLYGHAKKVYQKGCQARELVDALRMEIIRKKHADDLSELEKALNVTIQ